MSIYRTITNSMIHQVQRIRFGLKYIIYGRAFRNSDMVSRILVYW